METALLILLIVAIILLCAAIALLLFYKRQADVNGRRREELIDRQLEDSGSSLRQELTASVQGSVKNLGQMLLDAQRLSSESLTQRISELSLSISRGQTMMSDAMQNQLKQLEERIKTLELGNEQRLSDMRETISKRLGYIQEDNNKRLESIRVTVDEKLQRTLNEKMSSSFKLVSERLEQVYKGLGEMQSIAAGVGDLKRVLSNVKTRGILGEIQLGAILGEILSPEQYETEIPTVPGSREHVEFAVKLPAGEGEFIYLPIDSKFPGDSYSALQDAYDRGDPEGIKAAYKQLEAVIKRSAKDIHDKYIMVPYTTSFAIMFLPFEGLYAEMVNHGLVELLQREYSVNIAGPSTMAAMLNSLQMGFKTLQIQKRSSQVWQLLSAVKTEFDSFEKVFASAQNRIKQLDDDIQKLIGTRTRAIRRRLQEVEMMDSAESKKLLGLDGEDNIGE